MNFSKTNFLIVLLSLALLGTMVTGSAASKQKNTEVAFGLTQQGCWIELDAHDNLYLGTLSEGFSAGDTITSEDEGQGQKKIKVKTDCSNLSLSVSATDFRLPPTHTETAGEAIKRFGVKTKEDSSYSTFSGLNSAMNLKDITGADAPAGQATENIVVDYQYTVGASDEPGAYRAYLQYTASTE